MSRFEDKRMDTELNEKLVVDNFAGMKHIDLDIGKINLLIGPQATGKSVCAKLLYFFKNFRGEMITTTREQKTKEDLVAQMKARFLLYFPTESWPSRPFCARYDAGGSFIVMKRPSGRGMKLEFSYSRDFEELFETEFDKSRRRISKGDIPAADAMFSDPMGKVHRFIPAGRSFFAITQASIFSPLSNTRTLDPFLLDFGVFSTRMSGSTARRTTCPHS